MASNDFPIRWENAVALTTTVLNSLANGAVANLGAVNAGNPTPSIIYVSYDITFNAPPTGGDNLVFWLIKSDQDATTPIWPGGVSNVASQITTPQAIAEAVQGAKQPKDTYGWVTNHGSRFQGGFGAYNFGPEWQVLIQPVGEALNAGPHTVRYRYGVLQVQP